MPTLRQKIDQFCVAAGTTNASSRRIAKLEEALKNAKDDLKDHKAQTRKAAKKPKSPKPAKTKRVKMTDEEKGQRRRERAVVKELEKAKGPKMPAQAEPMMPAPAAPVPAPTLAPEAKGGRKGRLRNLAKTLRMRW
jgi:hypothetical protein